MSRISYDVISKPSPEYESGDVSGRLGIYTVVKLIDGDIADIVITFDGNDSSVSRIAAYEVAKGMNEAQRLKIELGIK